MTSSVFPDINVWMALTLEPHIHHTPAWMWYESLAAGTDLVFCRVTQLGFLRLLTNRAVAGKKVMTERQAWAAYDRWMVESDCIFEPEPYGFEDEFRGFSMQERSHPQEWGDSYLAAFAAAASMELVTFDRTLSMRAKRSILLKTMV